VASTIWLFWLQVAIICNHQRSVSKSHSQQMSRLTEKISELQVMTFMLLKGIGGHRLKYRVMVYFGLGSDVLA
jgi:hypothetical protein